MRKILTPKERLFLDRARVCRVGSVEPGGRAHVTPMCHALEGRVIYVATDRDGRTARNLRKRPRTTVTCDDYFEDWSKIRGVVVQARAHRVDRGPELKRAQRALVKKFRRYKNTELDYAIALRIEGVTSWGL